MDEHDGGLDVIGTENKGTATSASLYRMQNIMDAQDAVQVGSSICFCLGLYLFLMTLCNSQSYSKVTALGLYQVPCCLESRYISRSKKCFTTTFHFRMTRALCALNTCMLVYLCQWLYFRPPLLSNARARMIYASPACGAHSTVM